jgi:hypothetical protein
MGSSLLRGAVLPVVTVVGLLFAPSSACAASTATGNHARPNHRISHGVSTNWSGYALTGSGPYESVSASWTQPAVDCARTPTGWSAFWVGLDGDTTGTVEQTGTEADCSEGQPVYGAWYEMYPRYPVSYQEPVSAGDSFTASVTYVGKRKFKLTLSDTTEGWSQTVTKRLRSARLGSAEAIVEAPSTSREVLPLADFGTASFSDMTVNGSPVTGSTPSVEPITMVSERGLEAAPSALTGGSFSDTWYSQ